MVNDADFHALFSLAPFQYFDLFIAMTSSTVGVGTHWSPELFDDDEKSLGFCRSYDERASVDYF